MIKFFRKIRQRLLSENKFNKYLLYAIGEIVLVVIGILIALQINNFNTIKQKRIKEIVYLNEIKENLEDNLENDIIPGITNISKSLHSFEAYHSTLNNPSLNRNLDSVLNNLYHIINPKDIVLITVGFDNLNSAGIDLISNDSLRTSIATLYGYHYKQLIVEHNQQIDFTLQIIWPTIQNNINYSHDKITDEELNFLRTNGPFYSKLKTNSFNITSFLGDLEFLKSRVEQLILDIEDEVNQ